MHDARGEVGGSGDHDLGDDVLLASVQRGGVMVDYLIPPHVPGVSLEDALSEEAEWASSRAS